MRRKSPLILFLLPFLVGCTTIELPPEITKVSSIPYMAQAYPWSDTLVKYMTLEDKVGQLMLVDGGSVSDTSEQRKVEKTLRRYRVGGVLFDADEPAILSEQIAYFQGISVYPAWFGLKDGIFPNNWEDQMAMGAVADELILFDLGKATAESYSRMGIQLDLSLPIAVNYDRNPTKPALHESPDTVQQRVNQLLSGLTAGKLLACATPLPLPIEPVSDSIQPTLPQDRRSLGKLEQGELSALVPILSAGLPGIALQNHQYPLIDSTTSSPTLSGEITERYIRKGLQFDGLIFSPPLNDSLVWGEENPAEIAVQALEHGADVLVFPADPGQTVEAIRKAIRENRISQQELDRKVGKILRAKAWAGLDCWAPYSSYASLPELSEDEIIHRELNRSSLTLLRNGKKRLPLGNVMDLKIASLSIGTKNRTQFQRTLEQYQSLNHTQWTSIPDSATAKARLKKLGWYKYVIIGIHEPQPNGQLPAWFQAQLMELDQQSKVVLVNFANPGHLQGLDSLTSVVQAYGNSEFMQSQAAQFVYGGTAASGRLPIHLSDSFPAGGGLLSTKITRLGFAEPDEVGLPSIYMGRIDSILKGSVVQGVFPGCQVAVAKAGKIVYSKGFGYHTYDRRHRVKRSDLYDLASLTKVCATTLAVMRTYDQEEDFKLSDPLKKHLPAIDTSTVENIEIKDMMLHRAGLSAGLPIYKYMTYVDSVDSVRSILYSSRKDSLHSVEVAENLFFADAYRDSLMEKVKKRGLVNKGHYVYSDLGFFLLKEMLESIHEEKINKYMYREFYHPLGLKTITYTPLKYYDEDRIVPTERDRAWRKQTLNGYVHDPTTAMWGGVCGQAGLFANAEDLAILMQMLVQKGYYGGKRYLSEKTVQKFTQQHPDSHRGLGWDRPNHGSSKRGMCVKSASVGTFGHTGFTGTCIWVDPEYELVYIFLSNRVHPSARNQKINSLRVRQSVQQVLYDAMGITEVVL